MNFSESISLKDINSVDIMKIEEVLFGLIEAVDKDDSLVDLANLIKCELDSLKPAELSFLIYHLYLLLFKAMTMDKAITDPEETAMFMSFIESVKREASLYEEETDEEENKGNIH